MAGPRSPLRAKGSPGTRPMYRGSARLSPQAGSSTPGWATPEGTRWPLLAGQLAVEAGQGNGKGLQRTQWVVVIHGEHVLCYTAKLHHNVVRWSQAQVWTETEGQSRDGGDGEGQTPKSQEGRESEKQRSQENPRGKTQTNWEKWQERWNRWQRRKMHTNTRRQGRREEVHSKGVPTPETLLSAQNLGSGLQRRFLQGLPVIMVRKFFTPNLSRIIHVLKL